MAFLEFLSVPIVVFLSIVAPIWLILHYRSMKRSSRGLNREDLESIEDMLANLDKMAERIEVLESILDAEHSGWRRQSHRHKEPAAEQEVR